MNHTPHRDEGSAVIEFIALTLLFMIPLVYLVLTVGRVQAGALAAEAAAQSAARAVVVTGVAAREAGASQASSLAAGEGTAQAAANLVAEDFGFVADDLDLALSCAGACLEPGGNVEAVVTITVALPGIPGVGGQGLPLSIPVEANARASVDSVVVDR